MFSFKQSHVRVWTLACLYLFSGSCEEPESRAASWRPLPPWFQKLSDDDQRNILNADSTFGTALDEWKEGKLKSARKRLTSATTTYVDILGKKHWKTWEARYHLALLDAELKLSWDNMPEDWPRHLFGFRDAIEDLAFAKETDAKTAAQNVDEWCEFFRTLLKGAEFPPLADYYRTWGHVCIARRDKDPTSESSHLLEAASLANKIFPDGHPERAYTHCEFSGVLPDDAEPSDLDHARSHLEIALGELCAGLPATDDDSALLWVHVLIRTAELAQRMQRHADARKAFEAALSICETAEHSDSPLYTELLFYLARLRNQVHDNEEALKLLRWIARQGKEIDAGMVWEEKAIAYTGLGKFRKASRAFKKALGAHPSGKEGEEKRASTHFFYGKALLLRLLNDVNTERISSQEREQLRTAIDEEFSAANHSRQSSQVRELIELYRIWLRLRDALAQGQFERLPEILKELANAQPGIESRKCLKHRLCAYAQAWLTGRDEAAQRDCELAIESYENAGEKLDDAPTRFAFYQEKESPYLLAAIIARRLGAEDQALELLEQHAGQALARLSVGPSLAPEPGSLWAQLDKLEKCRLAASTGSGRKPGRAAKDHVSDRPVESPYSTALTAPQIFESPLLDDHTAIVGWVDDMPLPGIEPLPDSWAFVVKKSGCEWVEPANSGVSRKLPERVIQNAGTKVEAFKNSGKWLTTAFELYKNRFEQIMPLLQDVERLYVLNRGVMLGVPVELLPAEDPALNPSPKLLLDRFAIAYGPSCSALHKLHGRPKCKLTDGKFLGLKHPDLRFSVHEVETVSQQFSKQQTLILWVGAQTEDQIYTLATNGDLSDVTAALFSTHAHSDPLMLGRCYLEVGSHVPTPIFSNRDGRFDYWEISNLTLRVQILVASGCKSGRGRPFESEGYLGLPHAFFNAGARAVVVSLWDVPDSPATAILMDRFFENVLGPGKMEPGAALREAKHHVRTASRTQVRQWCDEHDVDERDRPKYDSSKIAYRHPYFWAGVILVGPQD